MHVLYVHQNFPAQFGHIADHLVKNLGWRCSFVSNTPPGMVNGIEKIAYQLKGGATKHNHFCTRTFENTVWHCQGVYDALKARPDVKPDLIVGHSGFGSTLFLRELYPDVPVVNFFEYYYRTHDADSDMDFRRDLNWAVPDVKYLRSRCRNAMILLDLQNCQVGYTPTGFQKSRFPSEYDAKIRTIFDGIDRAVYHGHNETLRPSLGQRGVRTLCGVTIPDGTKVLTYVSRGFESMRGFDIFMKAAKRVVERMPDVQILVIGTDRIAYGGDENHTDGKTFKQWVLDQDTYDLERIKFVGRVPPDELARTLAATDLHVYLTVPFVLSWSMMDAMSCGAVVLASDTAPVREMIQDGQNGLLADFFDPDDFADKACRVLSDPAAHRELGRAAEKMIAERYSLEAVLPAMLAMYDEALHTQAGRESAHAPPPPAPAASPFSTKPTKLPRPDVVTGTAPPRGWSPFRG
ncbi:MAG TPA: glycosyltransferase [Tepidisphaeraceae bacterium]|jgi:glycosyltransferase involved in cell wall biosynthesis